MDGVVGPQRVGVREIRCCLHEGLVDLDEIELREQTVELGHQPACGRLRQAAGADRLTERRAGFDPRQAHAHDAQCVVPQLARCVGAGFGNQEWDQR